MGYRTYLRVVRKDLVEDLHACETLQDLTKVQEKYNLNCLTLDGGFGSPYFKMWDLPYRDQFEFGKYCPTGRDTYRYTQNIFTTSELRELVTENTFRFGGIEAIRGAIDWTEKYIIRMYQNLLECRSDWEWEQHEIDLMTPEERKEYHYDMLLKHCKGYLNQWNTGIKDLHTYDRHRDHIQLTSDYLYEHTFWDLIRMWKSFDVEKESVIFIGY